ncbi:MAG: MBL fold metallo-hydrolase [Candidatus Kaiserbacteria bacterium]|nr:MBL fold metallo-hydrolase [Candidatus Kaiserbacteria bacterium]MCB9816724.1 MBL fold metallo-hydrolase [Candidatus Nomurabacteria bacterium]
MSATIGFYGGVGSVTGANFMLDTGKLAVLVDCGLEQGDKFADERNAEAFVYDPTHVDALFVTHAHADHIGRIPKLVREGFRGAIYSTLPTKELATIMFDDALHIMEYEAKRDKRQPIYSQTDIDTALLLWKTADYHEEVVLKDDVTATLTNAGHILGSAMVQFTRFGKKVVFTGDVGNVPQPLMDRPEVPEKYDYMVMESVYGDRVHEEVEERTAILKHYIQETIRKEGTLIIPAFSLERTQGILFEINNMVESGEIDPIKTYLDSPLAIRVTDVYKHAADHFRPEVQEQIEAGDDIFSFEGLSFTETVKESAEIARFGGPKIIIAGSGMSHGGRIREHEKQFLGDPNTTLLLVGYQTVGSIGRLLQDGANQVWIDGMQVRVKAQIATIRGYSGHADRNQLIDLVYAGTQDYQPKQVFVTMGEERASLFLTQRLRDYLGVNAIAPEANSEAEIDF